MYKYIDYETKEKHPHSEQTSKDENTIMLERTKYPKSSPTYAIYNLLKYEKLNLAALL